MLVPATHVLMVFPLCLFDQYLGEEHRHCICQRVPPVNVIVVCPVDNEDIYIAPPRAQEALRVKWDRIQRVG